MDSRLFPCLCIGQKYFFIEHDNVNKSLREKVFYKKQTNSLYELINHFAVWNQRGNFACFVQ